MSVLIGGGWAAIVILFVETLWAWPSDVYGDDRPFYTSGVYWGLGTLAAVLVVGGLTAVAVARRNERSGSDRTNRFGLILGAGAWLLGGLFNLFIYLFRVPFIAGDICGGSGGAGTFECLHRPGVALNLLGVAFSLAATPAIGVLLWAGTRCRLWAWLSPVLIFGLYLLALRMWQPHEGLGVPDRPAPVSAAVLRQDVRDVVVAPPVNSPSDAMAHRATVRHTT